MEQIHKSRTEHLCQDENDMNALRDTACDGRQWKCTIKVKVMGQK